MFPFTHKSKAHSLDQSKHFIQNTRRGNKKSGDSVQQHLQPDNNLRELPIKWTFVRMLIYSGECLIKSRCKDNFLKALRFFNKTPRYLRHPYP